MHLIFMRICYLRANSGTPSNTKDKYNDVLLKEENAYFLDWRHLDLLPNSDPERKSYLENKVCKENIINVIDKVYSPIELFVSSVLRDF
jgi:hypothetical protein